MVEQFRADDRISLDAICTLVSVDVQEDDNSIPKLVDTSFTQVFCGMGAVGRSEFYKAAQEGLSAELKLIINAFEYSGQDAVIFNDERYAVYRTYRRKDDYLELYLARRLGRE